jgi:hypothetical protein
VDEGPSAVYRLAVRESSREALPVGDAREIRI